MCNSGILFFSDVDECTENLHDCNDTHANCTNIPGSYSCVCNPSYYGDGKTCILNTRELRSVKCIKPRNKNDPSEGWGGMGVDGLAGTAS